VIGSNREKVGLLIPMLFNKCQRSQVIEWKLKIICDVVVEPLKDKLFSEKFLRLSLCHQQKCLNPQKFIYFTEKVHKIINFSDSFYLWDFVSNIHSNSLV